MPRFEEMKDEIEDEKEERKLIEKMVKTLAEYIRMFPGKIKPPETKKTEKEAPDRTFWQRLRRYNPPVEYDIEYLCPECRKTVKNKEWYVEMRGLFIWYYWQYNQCECGWEYAKECTF